MTKRNDNNITQEYIRAATTYCEETGLLYWRVDRPRDHFSCDRLYTCYLNRFAGKVCGNWNKRTDSKKDGFGYYVMRINTKTLKTHRMIFLYHKGYLPREVDHIDTNTRNCFIDNLREAVDNGNSYNQSTPNHNTTGFKGVSTNNSPNYKYKTSIMKEGRTYNLGGYNNLEEAASAYNIVAKVLFGEFCELNVTTFPESKVTKMSKFWKEYFPLLLIKEK